MFYDAYQVLLLWHEFVAGLTSITGPVHDNLKRPKGRLDLCQKIQQCNLDMVGIGLDCPFWIHQILGIVRAKKLIEVGLFKSLVGVLGDASLKLYMSTLFLGVVK